VYYIYTKGSKLRKEGRKKGRKEGAFSEAEKDPSSYRAGDLSARLSR